MPLHSRNTIIIAWKVERWTLLHQWLTWMALNDKKLNASCLTAVADTSWSSMWSGLGKMKLRGSQRSFSKMKLVKIKSLWNVTRKDTTIWLRMTFLDILMSCVLKEGWCHRHSPIFVLTPVSLAMVQDSITDHSFDRPQFFFISSYRVMFDINGKVFSFSIGWRHSFGKIRSRIEINPNKSWLVNSAMDTLYCPIRGAMT